MRIGEFSFTFLSTGAVLVVDNKSLSLVLPSVILLSAVVDLLFFDNTAIYGHDIHKGCNT